jgi:beta-lactamase regulating signal transducer with metallopeptidase domain
MNILINALGQALFESFGQALLIYVVLQLAMQFFPSLGSKYRYDVHYLGLTIICCWFLANLVKIYLHNMAMPHYTAMLYTGGITYTAQHAPTVLQQAEAFITHNAKYITSVYLLALMVQAIRLVGGFMHIQQIRKQKNLLTDQLWSAKAQELVQKLKIVKKVSLFLSEHVQIPLTIGHLKPIIIFPIALINNLDNDQVEAILLHELAHIKRHDYLLNILQCVMETILCFNPFVWLISKTIREQREFCCDDMVIDEDCNNYAYSRALFIIAQQNEQNYILAMASTGSKKYPLLNRIKRLNMKTTDTLPKFHLLVVLAIAALGLLLAWGIPQYSHAKAAHRTTKHFDIITTHNVNAPAAPVPPPVPPRPRPVHIAPPAVPAYPDTVPTAKLADTTKKHNAVNITITDDSGNTHVYHSLAEMPKTDRENFLKQNPDFNGGWIDTGNFRMSPEFQKQMADMGRKMGERFNNPEWRKQMADMRKQFNNPKWKKEMADMRAKIRKQYNNPEWRKQMADMQAKMHEQFNSPEWRKQMEDMQAKMREQFNSPEWRKQMADMQIKMKEQFNNPEWKKQMADMQIKMKEQFNSPEWKKQMADMQTQIHERFNSPEWKKQMQELKTRMKDINQEKIHKLERQNEEMREELRKKGDHKFDESEKDTSDAVKP